MDNLSRIGIGERAPWGDFPPVIRAGGLGSLKDEPEYKAAKSGDQSAALDLVDRLLPTDTIRQIRTIIGNNNPLLLPVLAMEDTGNNKIPLAMAMTLAERLGLDTEQGLVQRERVGRTGAGADHRLAFNPTFVGNVKMRQAYLLIDDTLTMGGTLASLRGYVENRGGIVIAASVMSAHPGAVDIAVKPEMLHAIERKHGPAMNIYWMEEFGYGIDKLTQGEAGHIKAGATVDAIRNRIAAARDEGLRQMDARGA